MLARIALALLGASSLASAAGCPIASVSALANSGTPVGVEEVHDGRGVSVPPLKLDRQV